MNDKPQCYNNTIITPISAALLGKTKSISIIIAKCSKSTRRKEGRRPNNDRSLPFKEAYFFM